MKRLTKKDWDLINSALAYYEAAGCGYDETGSDAALEQQELMPSTRDKVWDRL